MDALWVVISAGLLILLPLPMPGFWLIAGLALIVADFGLLEFLGTRSLWENGEQTA